MSVVDNLKQDEEIKQIYINNRITSAEKHLEENSNFDEAFKYSIEILDKYDFSEFLTDGRSLWDLRDAIEDKYDKEAFDKYGIYLFDDMDGFDTTMYFASRYNVWFQEYTDWVVRHDNGAYEKTRKRVKNSD